MRRALSDAVYDGRDGLGTIIVKSGGNARVSDDVTTGWAARESGNQR